MDFYLYSSPNLNCIHSKDNLEIEQQKYIIKELLKIANINSNNYIVAKKNSKKTKEGYSINNNRINIDNFKIVFTMSSKIKETEFEAMIRHLRNCFAHGTLFKCGKKLILIDSKNNVVSAVFILENETLNNWKIYLENQLQYRFVGLKRKVS